MDLDTLYALIVVQCGIPPDYFLDRMQWYEVDACLKGLGMSERVSWEQTRYICYITAQVNSRKQLKPSDIIRFEWDGEAPEDAPGITGEDFERMKRKARETAAKL